MPAKHVFCVLYETWLGSHNASHMSWSVHAGLSLVVRQVSAIKNPGCCFSIQGKEEEQRTGAQVAVCIP